MVDSVGHISKNLGFFSKIEIPSKDFKFDFENSLKLVSTFKEMNKVSVFLPSTYDCIEKMIS